MSITEAEEILREAALIYSFAEPSERRAALTSLKQAAHDYANTWDAEPRTGDGPSPLTDLVTASAGASDDILAEVAEFQRKLQQDLAVARAKDQENKTNLPEA